MENEFENCSFCTRICDAGGLFPIDHPHRGVSVEDPGFMKGGFRSEGKCLVSRAKTIVMPFVPLSKKLLRIVHTLGF